MTVMVVDKSIPHCFVSSRNCRHRSLARPSTQSPTPGGYTCETVMNLLQPRPCIERSSPGLQNPRPRKYSKHKHRTGAPCLHRHGLSKPGWLSQAVRGMPLTARRRGAPSLNWLSSCGAASLWAFGLLSSALHPKALIRTPSGILNLITSGAAMHGATSTMLSGESEDSMLIPGFAVSEFGKSLWRATAPAELVTSSWVRQVRHAMLACIQTYSKACPIAKLSWLGTGYYFSYETCRPNLFVRDCLRVVVWAVWCQFPGL